MTPAPPAPTSLLLAVLTVLALLATASPARADLWPGDVLPALPDSGTALGSAGLGTTDPWSGSVGPDRHGAAAAPVTGAVRSRPGRDRSRVAGRVALPPAPATDSWTGYAFDACRAPSRRVMDRWRVASPFHGVGIYIGGALRACPQRHLTRGWVRHQVRHGWKLLPIWVGPQASCTSYRRTIPARAGARHRYPAARALAGREARNAARAATRLGIVRGSTLWYDLEWFQPGRRACRTSALHFLSAWTEQLHRRGYRSGVYSSVSAGIAALGSVRGNGRFTKPDRLWFAWHNWRRDVRWDEYVRAPRWKQDARVHQYALDVVGRYGGVRMAIDRNYVDLGGSPLLRRTPAVCGRTADRGHYGEVRRGDRGSRVAVLTCLLRRTGHLRGVSTGFDATSRTALERFQRSRGLRVTGRAGDATWTALLAAGARPTLKRGSEGPGVRRLQRALTAALPGPVAVHGHFGPGTTVAVMRFQRRTGLRVTGVAAPSTWRALQDGETVERRAEPGRGNGGKHHGKSGKGKNGKKPGKGTIRKGAGKPGKKDGPGRKAGPDRNAGTNGAQKNKAGTRGTKGKGPKRGHRAKRRR